MKKIRKTISWNICGICNYNCTYCVQKRSSKRGIPDEYMRAKFIEGFTHLQGSWEIKISGGEPFLTPDFFTIIEGLLNAGHRISILTNFSSSLEELEEFIHLCNYQLRTFSISLHLEKVKPLEFLEKSLKIKQILKSYPKATFVVNSVVIPNEIENLIKIKEQFEAKNIKFYPQLMRVDGQTIEYAKEEKHLLNHLLGNATPKTANTGYNFKGQLCYAGMYYFIMNYKGDTYRCYPSKRFQDGYIGNFLDGTFKLWEIAKPCPYETCPCTVPINRGLVGA